MSESLGISTLSTRKSSVFVSGGRGSLVCGGSIKNKLFTPRFEAWCCWKLFSSVGNLSPIAQMTLTVSSWNSRIFKRNLRSILLIPWWQNLPYRRYLNACGMPKPYVMHFSLRPSVRNHCSNLWMESRFPMHTDPKFIILSFLSRGFTIYYCIHELSEDTLNEDLVGNGQSPVGYINID